MRFSFLRYGVLVGSLVNAAAAGASDPVFDIGTSKEMSTAVAVGTAITYQGKLEKDGVPVNGTCTVKFTLYDAATAGTQIGLPVTLSNVSVTNGFLTASLDFGAGAFNGQARWLEIQVQGTGDPGFTVLAPRQPITAAPYALYALGGSVGSSQWANDTNGITFGGNVGVGGGLQRQHQAEPGRRYWR
jgi:hypothetical protein